jgi:hypothetical protein
MLFTDVYYIFKNAGLMKKAILIHKGDFHISEENGIRLIHVLFYHSAFDTTRIFRLNDNELSYNFGQLKELARDIRNNYQDYTTREIKD